MRLLPATVLLTSLVLVSAVPADAQSATGTARGSARSSTGAADAARAAPSRSPSTLPRTGTVRVQGTATSPGVPVRDGTTSNRIPYANYDPYAQPGRVGTVQRQEPREGRWHRDDRYRDDRYRDGRYRDRHGRDPYYYDRYYYDPYYYPVIYYQSGTTHVVEVQRDVYVPVVVPAPAAARYEASPPYAHAQESCAIVTVLQPNYRGYWKELRLPVAGAVNTDELRRILNARIAEGVAFTLRDAAGETLDVPARAALDRIVVDPCR